MRRSYRKTECWRRRPWSILLACLALLSLGTPVQASSITILTYTQTNPADVITLNNNGSGTSTLSTAGNADGAGVSIPVSITSFLGVTLPISIPAFETFVNVQSSAAAFSFGGIDSQPFTGKIEITALPGGMGSNYLTAVFSNTDATSGPNSVTGGNKTFAAGLSGSQAPQTLTLTSDFALLAPDTSMSISFTNLNRALMVFHNSIGQSGNTTMQHTGLFSASVVPEPSSLVTMITGFAGVVPFGYILRRRRS